MTTPDAGTGPATAPLGESRRHLVRRRDDRRIAGVCAALGAYTDIDPVIYRVVLGVLAVFGGAGFILYGIGWLFIPELETGHAPIDAVLRRLPPETQRWRGWALAAVLLLALLLIGPIRDGGWTGVSLGALAVLAFLWLREHRPPAAEPPSADGPYLPATAATVPFSPRISPGVSPPPAPRSRSPLGLITLCVALAAVGVGLLLDASGALHVSVLGLLVTALVVVCVGLVVGVWVGHGRWLVVPALLLGVAVVAAGMLHNVPLSGGAGNRLWAPASAADVQPAYRLGAGDATLDLSTFGTPAGLRQIHASVGSGQLTVRLPAALPVTVHAHAGAGRLKVVGQVTDGLSAERDLSSGGPTVNRLDLDLRVGIGQVTVTRVSP